MNIFFVGKRTNESSSGIEKKMMGQIKAFESLGHKVYYTYFEDGNVYLTSKHQATEKIASYKENIFSKYLANELAIKTVLKQRPYFFQMFYMRKGLTSWYHLMNLKEMKKQKIKIVEEIPTYPYDRELLKSPGWGLKLYYVIDNIFRGSLKKYVDLFVTYSEDKSIWGVPAVPVNNGIDMDDIPLCPKKVNENSIHMITVSAMYYWHGYERLIYGMADYYKKNKNPKYNIIIDMVGDGFCRDEWEKVVKENGLVDHFKFWGQQSGKELDEIFELADIAVASLGLYKKDLEKASELKVREYCARGIPFVLGCKDLGFDKRERFVHYVSNDDSIIDIEAVINFYLFIGDREQCKKEMRNFAKENFGWDIQLKKVISKIEGIGV